jgi:hypothetical protein
MEPVLHQRRMSVPWNRDVAFLLALTLLGASFGVVHVSLWLRTLRAPGAPALLRWLAIVPPLTAIVGFRCGKRWHSVLWCIVVAAYVVLRSYA